MGAAVAQHQAETVELAFDSEMVYRIEFAPIHLRLQTRIGLETFISLRNFPRKMLTNKQISGKSFYDILMEIDMKIIQRYFEEQW